MADKSNVEACSSEEKEQERAEADMAMVKGVSIVDDEPADMAALFLVMVYAEARCPRCSIRLATYTKYVESPRAIIGGTVTISFTGSCYNRGGAGSGVFDWRGTVTSGYIYEIP